MDLLSLGPKTCTIYDAGEEPIIEFLADVESSIRTIRGDADFKDKIRMDVTYAICQHLGTSERKHI